MAKMTVISHHGRIRGIFTQKKKLWEVMGMDELAKELMVAITEVKFTDLTYTKMCKYLKERGVLQIYESENIVEGDEAPGLDCSYILWDIETNTFYDPELPDELKEKEEDPTLFGVLEGALNNEIPEEKYGVHENHCCKEHGCKYSEQQCPVVNGKIEQAFPCEECNFDREVLGENTKSREKFSI